MPALTSDRRDIGLLLVTAMGKQNMGRFSG
jgi:hypothetical protein